jgi:excisionase family DNA binding protein
MTETPKALSPSATDSGGRVRPGRVTPIGSVTLSVPERFLTTREVAERLGVHAKTVLRYVRTSGLPVCRLPGNDLRFAWPEVSRWLTERKEART